MTHKEMRTMFRLKLDDPNGQRYADESVRLLLNEAFRDVWNSLLSLGLVPQSTLTTSVTLTPTSTNNVVEIASDVQKVVWVKYNQGKAKINHVDEAAAVQSEEEVVFIRNGRYLGYYIPITENKVFDVLYIPVVSQYDKMITDNEKILDISEEYHNVIVTWAVILGFGGDRRSEAMKSWGAIYDKQFNDLVLSINPREVTIRKVVDTYGDSFG